MIRRKILYLKSYKISKGIFEMVCPTLRKKIAIVQDIKGEKELIQKIADYIVEKLGERV